MKKLALALTLLSTSAMATDLPVAIDCYQTATNAENIDDYMSCFADNAEMIDVTRTFVGADKIRPWAVAEVMPHGKTFEYLETLPADEVNQGDTNSAKTLVQWWQWKAHYYFWWNDDGKITKMSLQYAD